MQQPIPLFLEDQRQEARVFMGDTVFWSYVEDLCAEPFPLLALNNGGTFRLPNACRSHEEFTAQTIVLTEHARAVLEGRVDYRDHQPIVGWAVCIS